MKVKDITLNDMQKLCSKYLNKEHNCLNCPLFNIKASPKYMSNGVSGISSACGILNRKWTLEKQVLENDAELNEICEEELENGNKKKVY